MAMEFFTSKMEDTIKDNGKTTKCTGSANFTMKMEQSHIKDIGKTMNSMAKEGFTTQNQ
jgi:hypothetical protein